MINALPSWLGLQAQSLKTTKAKDGAMEGSAQDDGKMHRKSRSPPCH